MTTPHFQRKVSHVKNDENETSNIIHHPWKAEKTIRNSTGSYQKIDRFLTRSRRRKSGSWGSDSSTIFTESTGQSSLSSYKSSSSPVPLVRRIDVTQSNNAHAIPAHYRQYRDPRETIGSIEAVLDRQNQNIAIDVDSLEEYDSVTMKPKRPGPDRGLDYHNWVGEDVHTNNRPLPPRSPRRPQTMPTLPPHKKLTLPPPKSRSHLRSQQGMRYIEPRQPGPVDVDLLEDEDACSESLNMAHIEEEPEISEDFSDWRLRKPSIAARQRTNSSSLNMSLSIDDSSFHSYSETEDEWESDEEEISPLESLMALEKLDLLVESDGEEDYAEIRSHMGRFPVLEEGEVERGLCSYIRGFEPPVEAMNYPKRRRHSSRPSSGSVEV